MINIKRWCIILFPVALQGAVGCFSYSYRLNPVPIQEHMAFAWRTDDRQFDYKNLKPIMCNHPCRIGDLDDKGRCRFCRHFGIRTNFSIAGIPNDAGFITDALERLKAGQQSSINLS